MVNEIFNLDKLKYLYSINDKRFGKIKIFEDENFKKYMAVEIITNSDIEFNMYIKLINEKMKYNCNKLWKLNDYSINKIDERTNIISVIYDYFDFDFQNLNFNDELMKSLITDLIEALNYLQKMNKINGNLSPNFIAYNESKKNFLLLDVISKNINPNQIQIKNIKNNTKIYLSPIIYYSIKNKLSKVKHNAFKSEIFSWGLIILELGLKKDIQEVYKNHKIDNNKLNYFIEEFCRKFKNNFNEIIKSLLIISESSRPEPQKLFCMIMKKIDNSFSEKFTHKSLVSYPLNYSWVEENDKKNFNSKVDKNLQKNSFKKITKNYNSLFEIDNQNEETNKEKVMKFDSENIVINIKNNKKEEYNGNSFYIGDNIKRIYIPMKCKTNSFMESEKYDDDNENIIFEENNSEIDKHLNYKNIDYSKKNKYLIKNEKNKLSTKNNNYSISTSKIHVIKNSSLQNYNYSKYKPIQVIRNGYNADDIQYYVN